MSEVYKFAVGDVIKCANPAQHCYTHYSKLFRRANLHHLFKIGEQPARNQLLKVVAVLQHCVGCGGGFLGRKTNNMYICQDLGKNVAYAFDEASLELVSKAPVSQFQAVLGQVMEREFNQLAEKAAQGEALTKELEELRAFKQRVLEAVK